MKRFLALILALTMVLCLVACGNTSKTEEPAPSTPAESTAPAAPAETEQESFTFMLAHIRPEGSTEDLAIREFVEEVKEKTNGTVVFEVYPAAQLGDAITVDERVSIGDVDAQIATLSSGFDKRMNFGYLCSMISTWEEAEAAFNTDSSLLLDIVNEVCADHNLKYLGCYPKYFGGIALTKLEFDPYDFTTNPGTEIRTPSTAHHVEMTDMLGFTGVPLGTSEIFTALQTGMIYGLEGMGAEGIYSNYADLIKYFLAINTHFDIDFFIMNQDTWNKLSAEQQAAIQEAATNMQTKRFVNAPAETEQMHQNLRDAGIEVIEYTDEQRSAIANQFREERWPVLQANFDSDLQAIFDKVIAEYGSN